MFIPAIDSLPHLFDRIEMILHFLRFRCHNRGEQCPVFDVLTTNSEIDLKVREVLKIDKISLS